MPEVHQTSFQAWHYSLVGGKEGTERGRGGGREGGREGEQGSRFAHPHNINICLQYHSTYFLGRILCMFIHIIYTYRGLERFDAKLV